MGYVYERPQKREQKRVVFPEINSLLGIWNTIKGAFTYPKLELVRRFQIGSQGFANAYEIHYELVNTGKATVREGVIDLWVAKPRDISIGSGLLFDEVVGTIEAKPVFTFLPSPQNLKPRHYRYRLNPGIFISPGHPPLPVIRFIKLVKEDSDPADVGHEIEWTVSFPGGKSTHDKIIIAGATLKKAVMDNKEEHPNLLL